MSNPLRFIPPRVALTDAKTGMISREWYLFFQGMFDRVGGASAPSIPDIVVAAETYPPSRESDATLYALEQAQGQLPPTTERPDIAHLIAEVAALRDQLAELTKTVDGIYQGTNL